MKKWMCMILMLFISGCGDGQTPPAGTGTSAASPGTATSTQTAAPRTWTVDSKPGADFTSVTQAAREAGPQDTIKVRPGTYVGATVLLSKQMTLIGEGKASEIIIQCEKSSAVIVDGADVKISNVTLISNSEQPAVHVRVGKFALQDCTVTCKQGTAVFLGGMSDATLTQNLLTGSTLGLNVEGILSAEKNTISENEDGVLAFGKSLMFKNNRLARNKDNGLIIRSTLKPQVAESNEIFLSTTGVLIMGKVDPVIRKNKIHDIGCGGVQFDKGCTGLCEENEIQHCHIAVRVAGCEKVSVSKNKLHDNYCGVFADLKGSAVVDGNDIWKSEACGVYCEKGGDLKVTHNTIHECDSNGCGVWATMIIEDNDIYKNGQPGILVQVDGVCQARRNKIHDQTYYGVSTYGKGIFEDNDITSNREYGVMVRPKSGAVFRKNRITGNHDHGVFVSKDAGGTFEDNEITGNDYGAWETEEPAPPLTRVRNKVDPNAVSRAKVGDWMDVVLKQTGPKTHTSHLRMVLTAKNEFEGQCEQLQWDDGKSPIKSNVIRRTGEQHVFLQDFMNELQEEAGHHELDHGQEVLEINGRHLNTTWTTYELRLRKMKLGQLPIKMKVWISPELPIDETVKAVVNLNNEMTVEFCVVAFGDANTPKPDAPVKTDTPKRPDVVIPPPANTPPAVKPPVAEAPVEKPKPKAAKISVLKLKNGSEIRATLVIETGEQYSVKNEEGDYQTLNKDDVVTITKE